MRHAAKIGLQGIGDPMSVIKQNLQRVDAEISGVITAMNGAAKFSLTPAFG